MEENVSGCFFSETECT